MQALFPDFSFAQGMDSDTQKKIIVSVVIILLVWLIRITILRFVWKSTNNHKSRYLWKRIMSFVAPITVIILIGMVWVNAFRHVGTFLGLLSAGIAIALKDTCQIPCLQVLYIHMQVTYSCCFY